jgi:putative ABC transport system ATP-binding protein
MALLQAFDLYRFYHAGEEETLALRGVSLAADSGELLAVMGPSGSGKSTLLACLAGLDEPDGGYVVVDGQRITRRPEWERAEVRARNIGVMQQSGNLLEHLTLLENVLLQARIAKRRAPGIELLRDVGLAERRDAHPAQLSGGEAARAGLAVALAASPRILLADEPTGEVDAQTEARVIDMFDRFRKAGGAVIIATHSEALARRADRVLRLRDGRVVE